MKRKTQVNINSHLMRYGLFILLITAFCITKISPSLNADDSPETVTAQYTLGIQHPPGYPLNTLTGKIFGLLPLGSHMFRSNIMSLFFHVMTAVLLFVLVKSHLMIFKKFNTLFAFLVPVIYLFTYTPFLQASSAKGGIYTMNAFFTVLLFMNLFNIRRGGKFLYIASFIYGISMANHWQSMIVLLPAIIIYMYYEKPHIDLHMAVNALLLFVLGTTVYLFVIIRSSAIPAYAWGEIKNLQDLFWLISLKHYIPDVQIYGAGISFKLITFYIKELILKQYGCCIVLFSIPGIIYLFIKNASKSVSFFLAYACIAGSILFISAKFAYMDTKWVMEPFFTSSYLFLSIFIATGICWILDKTVKTQLASKKIVQISAAGAVFIVLFFTSPDFSRHFLVYDYLNNVAKTVPDKSVYFSEGEMDVFGSAYLRYVDKKDFVPVTTFLLAFDWYRDRLKKIYGGNLILPSDEIKGSEYLKNIMVLNEINGIYYSGEYTKQWQSFDFVPYGIINKVETENSNDEPRPELLKIYSYRGIFDGSLSYDDFGDYMIVKPYGIRIRAYGDLLFRKKDYINALDFYKKSIYFYKDDYVFNAMGACYYYLNDFGGANIMFENALKINANNVDSYVYLALIMGAQRNYTAATEYFDRALMIRHNDSAIMQLKSQVLNAKKTVVIHITQ